jgi:hypothetical protein
MKEILAHHVKITSLKRVGENKKTAPSEPTLFSKPNERTASPEKISQPKSEESPMLKARKVEDMALAAPTPKRMKVNATALFAFLSTHFVQLTSTYYCPPFFTIDVVIVGNGQFLGNWSPKGKGSEIGTKSSSSGIGIVEKDQNGTHGKWIATQSSHSIEVCQRIHTGSTHALPLGRLGLVLFKLCLK